MTQPEGRAPRLVPSGEARPLLVRTAWLSEGGVRGVEGETPETVNHALCETRVEGISDKFIAPAASKVSETPQRRRAPVVEPPHSSRRRLSSRRVIMGSKVKGVKKSNKPTRGKAPGGRVYEVAQAILSAPEGGVAAVIRAALNDKEAPIRRDPRAFTMFSTRCRKKGEWAKCVEIFDAMRDQGIETNTIVHNATMSACSKGGDWERALELFDAMPGEGHERSTITYNVAMGACMRGGDWERALELFDEMETEGLERDHVSVNTAMAAAEAGGDAGRMRRLTGGGAGGGAGGEAGGGDDDAGAELEPTDESDESDDDSDDEREPEPRLGPKPPRASPFPPADDADDEDREPVEEDPIVRERRLKAERRDARRAKFEEKRRARKAARMSRPWVAGDAGPSDAGAQRAGGEKPPSSETRKRRKEWGGNPLKWVDEDEGVKRKKSEKKGREGSSDDEEDPHDDGLPPITGPSVLDAPEEDAEKLLNRRDGDDDFWGHGF